MPCPGTVHQRIRFVFLVFGKNLQCACIQFRVFAAGIESSHPPDGQQAMFVANLGDQISQILEESYIVRNGVPVWQNPLGIFKIEMDQAGHVIPAPKIQSHNVVAKIPGKLFHLKSERMRFHQRHALDGIRGQALEPRDHLEKVAPPQSFIRGLRLRNVNAQRMLQLVEVHLISDHCHIKKRSGQQFAGQDTSLMNMQSTRPRENHCAAWINSDSFVPLAIEISQFPRKRLKNIFDSPCVVLP